MSEWPENDAIARFDDLVQPILDAIRQVYRIRFKGYKDLIWRGPKLPESMAAACHQYDEKFKAYNLRYSCQDQGRSPLTEIIAVAVQLGVEQGRRMALVDHRKWMRIKDQIIETLNQSNDHPPQ